MIRLAHAGTREALLQDYVRFARAKGLRRTRIVGVHVLKNILIPVVTVIGLEFGSMIAFAVVTETVFAWPGMGKLLIDSIHRARPAGDRRLPDRHRLHLRADQPRRRLASIRCSIRAFGSPTGGVTMAALGADHVNAAAPVRDAVSREWPGATSAESRIAVVGLVARGRC